MSIKVLGHLSPDTDSTCSPIVYAWYLKQRDGLDAKAVVTGELNREAKFILEKFEQEAPEMISKLEQGEKIVIVDTNNPDELVSGYDQAEIIEIIDHHKLTGGLSTEGPINVTIRTTGCTATIIWSIIKSDLGTDVPKFVIGLLAGCIISDSLNRTSPTTTEEDLTALEELAELGGFDIDMLAEEMFAAKSDLTGMSGDDLIKVDSKVYEFAGKKYRLSVLETTKPENALSMQQDILEAIKADKATGKSDHVMMFIIDIIKQEATVIVETEEEKAIISQAYETEFSGDTVILPGIVSRKKQIVPVLEKSITG